MVLLLSEVFHLVFDIELEINIVNSGWLMISLDGWK